MKFLGKKGGLTFHSDGGEVGRFCVCLGVLKRLAVKKNLTQVEISCSPVVVQFGIQFLILAIHFNSLCVEVYCVAIVFLLVCVIALILVHFCYG